MKDFKIIINDDFILSDQSNEIGTTFYLDYKGTAFPDNQWTDLTYSVLGMWTYSLLAYKNSEDVTFRLYFLDGPYRLDVYKDKNQQLTVNCINFRDEVKCELNFNCHYIDFLSAMQDALKGLAYSLYCNNMSKGRFEKTFVQIQTYLKELKKAMIPCSTYDEKMP